MNLANSLRRYGVVMAAAALLVVAPGPAVAAAELSLDAQAAVRLALQQSPRLEAAELERDQAALAAVQATADAPVRPNRAALQRATLGKAVAELNWQGTRQQVAREALKGYYELLAAREQLKIAEGAAENAASVVTAVKAKVAEGVAADLEALTAERAREEADAAALTAAEAVRLAEANLCLLLGLPLQTSLSLSGSGLEFVPLTLTEAELADRGLAHSVEVARAGQELAVAEAEAAVAAAGDAAELPRRLAELTRDQAALVLRQAKDAVALRARQLAIALARTRRQYEASQFEVTLAEASYRSTRTRFDEGLALPTELVKADLDLTSARVGRTKALLEYHLARLEALDFSGAGAAQGETK